MDETNDTSINTTELYEKHLSMVEHVLNDSTTNDAGKRFVRGIKKFYVLQGYITEKQQSVLNLIYTNSIEKLR